MPSTCSFAFWFASHPPSHVLRPCPACQCRSPPQLQHLGPGKPDEGPTAGGGPPAWTTCFPGLPAALIWGRGGGQTEPQGRPVLGGGCGALGRSCYREGSAGDRGGGSSAPEPVRLTEAPSSSPGSPEGLLLACPPVLRSQSPTAESNLCFYAAFHST